MNNGSRSKGTTTTVPEKDRPLQRRPSRWNTKEFYCYYAIILIYLLLMIKTTVNLSRPSHSNYWIYEKRLSDGWIFGRKVDNTDRQFRTFRDGLPSLLALSSIYLLLSKSYSIYLSRRTRSTPAPPSTPNPNTPYQRIPFLVVISLIILFILHGISAFKILLLLYLNYKLHSLTGNSKWTPYAIWVFNIGMLFCNEIFKGYPLSGISAHLAFIDQNFSGLMPGWHVTFNISMLRMVSFSLDWYWARTSYASNHTNTETTYNPLDYTWQNYVSYILYPPLYIGGPIVTFSSFITQIKTRTPIPTRQIVTYAIRFIVCWLTMEILLHYMYVVAIKDSWASFRSSTTGEWSRKMAWEGDTPFELAMISFWNLVVMWLKLLLPWRFFRLWSLMDGVDPPENMIRCVLNNYSTRGFWRSWHRSYNLWLIKYLYVPIASSTNSILAMLLVFTFVALWHDLSLHLLAWGWLITVFVLPETIAVRLVPEEKYGNAPWYRHLAAFGALCNIFMMITANTIGFVLGVDNTLTFLKQVFCTSQGLGFVLQAVIGLFAAVQIMFEYREEELRHGIVRKC
ncbi:MBOAT-domain-containing protein [Cystobasidium minutum MCA 4210]|uniref:MBOAT-domain-containing protein n=1 Tax=Cystobasidium minutum MCA 4210 TaxID=1397322 RepID=UPI0034CEFF2E|eukprot:jgi/Rhomi1/113632/CE113631_1112